MATKHPVIDTDNHFIVNPETRSVVGQSATKKSLMQYDHNSERFTFELPLEIEGHDMSLCDVIEIWFENSGTGTSVSTRKVAYGVYKVRGEGEEVYDDVDVDTEKEVMTFSWLVKDKATQYAGTLKFQLKFICHDPEFADKILYKWHTNINSEISITAGLPYSADDMSPATTATLQSLEIVEYENGIDIILDNRVYTISVPKSGTIDENSSDEEFATAKAVYDLVNTTVGDALTTDVEV